MRLAVASLGQLWTAHATDEFIALVEQGGGMLRIVASAVGPEAPAAMEVLMDAMESWDSMTRSVPLISDASGRGSRTARCLSIERIWPVIRGDDVWLP